MSFLSGLLGNEPIKKGKGKDCKKLTIDSFHLNMVGTSLCKTTSSMYLMKDGQLMDSHPDIGYRVVRSTICVQWCDNQFALPTHWHGHWASRGGHRGVFVNLRSAQRSMQQLAPRGEKYGVWKFHIGTTDSDIPYFLPEKVF